MSERVPDGRRTATRERLVRSAEELFRRRGVGDVGVAEICAMAGVGKGVFAHHFPGGKDELVGAVVAANAATVHRLLTRTVAAPRPLPELVGRMFDGYARVMREHGHDYGCPIAAGVVGASAGSAGARAAAHRAFASWTALLATRCRQDTAELVIAGLEGAILLARAADDPGVLERAGAAMVRLLESGPLNS
jgi:TetR/AcrR family transcriptional regulator, lmrAB and yxaGH operons repressor